MNTLGSISFQAVPCVEGKKTEKITINKRTASRYQICLSVCERENYVCNSELIGADGAEVCQEEKDACTVSCSDPKRGKYLKRMAKYSRDSFLRNREYEKKINEIEEEYKYKSIEREKNYNKKIEEIPCNSAKERLKDIKIKWKQRKSYTIRDEKYYRQDIFDAEAEISKKCKKNM